MGATWRDDRKRECQGPEVVPYLAPVQRPARQLQGERAITLASEITTRRTYNRFTITRFLLQIKLIHEPTPQPRPDSSDRIGPSVAQMNGSKLRNAPSSRTSVRFEVQLFFLLTVPEHALLHGTGATTISAMRSRS